MKRHSIDEVKALFNEHGLILDSDIYKNSSQKLVCHDSDGYYYECTYDNVKHGKKPRKYIKWNKYTLSNIQHLFELNGCKTKILSKKYINEYGKLDFRCECGEYYSTDLNNILRGKMKCSKCTADISRQNSSAYSKIDGLTNIEYYKTQILEKCAAKNYDVFNLDSIKNTDDCFSFICPKHRHNGEQITTYNKFIRNGSSCKYCGIEQVGIANRSDIDNVIKLINARGYEYVGHDYYKSTEKCSSKIHIRCKCKTCGKIWTTTVDSVKRNSCPNCKISNYEKIVRDILDDLGVAYIEQYKFNDCTYIRPLPFDFYLSDKNVLIEVDGQAHYHPVRFGGISENTAKENFNLQKIKDNIKTEYCKQHGIPLIRIPFSIIDNGKTLEYITDNI